MKGNEKKIESPQFIEASVRQKHASFITCQVEVIKQKSD